MDRRTSGVLLLVLAMLAAVVVIPGASGRPIAGSPVRQTSPPPPQVGDCVHHLNLPRPDDRELSTFPTADPAPCKGDKIGEVVGSLDQAASEFAAPSGGARFEEASKQEAEQQCAAQVAAFLGLTLPPGLGTIPTATSESGRWVPVLPAEPLVIGPAPKQLAAGADWLVCLAVVSSPPMYSGTLRGLLAVGTDLSDRGQCSNELEPGAQIIPCGDNHRFQVLASSDFGGFRAEVEVETVERTCLSVAAAMTRVDDPTFAGRLSVVADQVPGHGQLARCMVGSSSGRYLNRSLIGIGDRPLPWAP